MSEPTFFGKMSSVTMKKGVHADSNDIVVDLAFEQGDTGSSLRIRFQDGMPASRVSEILREAADTLDAGVKNEVME